MPVTWGWGGGGQLLIRRSCLNILKSIEAYYKAIQF